ncbi:MAG: hypothetical protein ACK5L3_08745 [Oscillospiraceae bacterium]
MARTVFAALAVPVGLFFIIAAKGIYTDFGRKDREVPLRWLVASRVIGGGLLVAGIFFCARFFFMGQG